MIPFGSRARVGQALLPWENRAEYRAPFRAFDTCRVAARLHMGRMGRKRADDRAPLDFSDRERVSMAKVAFLGLGVMGYPMAGHLKNKGGHEVTVYNRTTAKAEKWGR